MTDSGKNPYAKQPDKKPEGDVAPLISVPLGTPGEESAEDAKAAEKKQGASAAAWPGLEEAAAEGKKTVEKAPRIPAPGEKKEKPKAAAGDKKPEKPAQDVPALVQVPHTSTEPDEGWTAATVEKNHLANWALGVGIASLASLIVVVAPLLVGLVGIIVGILAVRKAKKNTTEGRHMGRSVAGLVMSATAFIISLVTTVVVTVLIARNSGDIIDCRDKYPDGSDEQTQCIEGVIQHMAG
ncbi:hypothetical protein H7347_02285 [Corynebacterium sp. zg-331]|uniref:DUF4190 domain-containing protein n=1 Tax=unclassified Corynebacterium TaxID=2624378 RepID=UPI00128E16F6|nr:MULTISPECIES: DUF4190 domain-containing protein [unclassified Corynebacterium]MBC3185416.1 hypothetical protein [Corynebacterium sp. zg-331]MPV51911.1 hypothetical protein [Corynebacterium sp. zg331]